jgi:Deltaproteobacterial GC-motif protein sorting domain
MYARYIYELINFGVAGRPGGLAIAAEPVDSWSHYSPPPPTSCDYSGCAQFYAADPSNYSDYSRGPGDIDYIIIHTVQGSYDGAISWFANPASDVSAHYVVRSSDGAVTQCVKEEDVAWHAGNWDYNLAAVGIEHEGYVEDPGTWYTDAMYQGSAKLSADIAARESVPIDRDHIIGHSEVPGCPDGSGGGSGCHTDPGSGWDWDYYMSLVSGGDVTGNIIGVVADTDIYDSNARLAGATVTIAETGETTTTDSTGYYYFYDEPLDTYTMHATMDGYLEGTCTKSLSTGDNWCSIALTPDTSTGGGDDTAVTSGDDTAADTGTTAGPGDTGPGWDGPSQGPGKAVAMSDVGGCGCATGGRSPWPGVAWLVVAGLAIGVRRRE